MLLLLALIPLAAVEVALRVAGIGGSVIYGEDPDFGYKPLPGQRFSTMGHPITILPDGFRAPAATNSLLFVGDSITYGTAYLRNEDTFPAQLGAANGGVNGWGPQNIARYLAKADLGRFRAVVWVMPSCDVLRPFMTLREGLISTNRRMLFRLEYLLRFLWYGHLRPQATPAPPAEYEPNWKAVADTHLRLKRDGKRLLVVFLPYSEEAMGRQMPETVYFQRMIAQAAEEGIPFVVAEPAGDVQRLYRDVGHLTPDGCRWLADVIATALKEEGI